MTMWLIIMWTTLAVTGIGLVYLSSRLEKFGFMDKLTDCRPKRKSVLSIVLVFGLFALIGWQINFMNAIVCTVYFALVWALCDFANWLIIKIRRKIFKRYYAGVCAFVISIAALACGWYLDHQVWQTDYNLNTQKSVRPLKIAMFADSHLGTTFDAEGFAVHLANIQAQQPDMLIIAGDFVDDDTSREDMLKACQALGKFQTRYGTYFAFGNHDSGYYGSAYRGFGAHELIAALQQNGVKVLRDEAVLVDNELYVIGRRDLSDVREKHGARQSMQELMQNLDNQKYTIVIDHQPADYAAQADAGVDLVLSGHTHGGQLFPFNQVGKWIGANDRIYGLEKRGNTNFIVTSGISDWAIKFKTGTKSEYVIINVEQK